MRLFDCPERRVRSPLLFAALLALSASTVSSADSPPPFGAEKPSLIANIGWTAEHAPLFPGAIDSGFRVASDANGNFIVAGETKDDRHGYDLLVHKYDKLTGFLLWEFRYNGPGNGDDISSAIAVNGAGDVIVAATSRGSSSFDDYYVAKLDGSNGSLLWEQRHDGPGNSTDGVTAIALDSSGNALVTGYVWNGSNYDMRTLKLLGATGQVLWQETFNGSANGEDSANSVAVDSQDNAVVTGYVFNGSNTDYQTIKYLGINGGVAWSETYAGTGGADVARLVAINGDDDVAVTGVSSNGTNDDILTLLYTAAGSFVWERRLNGPGNGPDGPRGLAFDHAGHVVVAGTARGLVNNDISIARYNVASGAIFWETLVGSDTGNDFGRGLVIDSTGNIYVTGQFSSGSNFDYWTIKLSNSTGVVQWDRIHNGPADGEDFAWGITLNNADQLAVTGRSENELNRDMLTISYAAANGQQQWEHRYDGPTNNEDVNRGVAVDLEDNVLVTGSSWNGKNYDLVTMKFAAKTGELLWETRYNGPADGNEFGSGAIDSHDGDVVVTTSSSNGANDDFYTARYSGEDGSLVWQRRYDGTGGGSDIAMDVLIDPADGIVIVTGASTGIGTELDYYTAMYAWEDGSVLWQHRYDGFSGDDFPLALARGPDGNFAITGRSDNNVNFYDILTIKYDGQSGAVQWTKRFDGAGGSSDEGQAVAIGPNGDVAVTGTTWNGASLDIYTAMYAADNGDVIWDEIYDGPINGRDQGQAIGVDAAGDVVITGFSEDQDIDEPILRDGYTAKYAAGNGALLWSRRSDLPDGNVTESSLDLDSEGKVGQAFRILVSPPGGQGFVAYIVERLSSEGLYEWFDLITSGSATDNDPLVKFTGADNLALAAEYEQDYFARLYLDYPWPELAVDNAEITVPEDQQGMNTGTFSSASGNEQVTLSATWGTVTKNDEAGTWEWTGPNIDYVVQFPVFVYADDGRNPPERVKFVVKVEQVFPAFYRIGDLPGGIHYSQVRDATRAGNSLYAVGGTSTVNGSSGMDTAFFWTSTGGLSALPNFVENSTASTPVFASAITPDGAFIATRSRTEAVGGQRRAARIDLFTWLPELLTEPAGFADSSAANAISSNGVVLYGFGNGLQQAVRYLADGSPGLAIPFLNPGDDTNAPAGRGTSADGSVMVGTSGDNDLAGSFFGPGNRAYRYVHGTGISAIALRPGGTWNFALGVSPDGNLMLAAGNTIAAPFGEVYVVQAGSGTQTSLGTPNVNWNAGNLGGMTADGNVIAVSFGTEATGQNDAFVRTSSGWHRLQNVATEGGIDLAGWEIDQVNGISPNGTLLWGSGLYHGNREGWVMEFPVGYLAALEEPPPIEIFADGFESP